MSLASTPPSLAVTDANVASELPEKPSISEIYPLEYSWTMFYDPPNKRTTQENYNTNLQALITVDSIETTCFMIQNIPAAAELPSGTSLSFFRSNIKPSWEDPHNSDGGKWTCSIPKDASKSITKLWEDAIFLCIGNEYSNSSLINGVVLSIRQKTDRIAFWIADASSEVTLKDIAQFIKAYLELPTSFQLTFQLHADALKGSSRDHLVF